MRSGRKRCVVCKQCLPSSEFNRRALSADGLQKHCRECNRQASRAYYRRMRRKHLLDVRVNRDKHIARNRELLLEHLLRHPCVDCGERDLEVLEFDHVRGKKIGSVAKLAGRPVRLKRLSRELAKCEVRCVNCHRRRSARTLGWWSASVHETSPPKTGSSE